MFINKKLVGVMMSKGEMLDGSTIPVTTLNVIGEFPSDLGSNCVTIGQRVECITIEGKLSNLPPINSYIHVEYDYEGNAKRIYYSEGEIAHVEVN